MSITSISNTNIRIPAGQEKFVAIADLQGWGYSCSDIRGYLAALSILQVCKNLYIFFIRSYFFVKLIHNEYDNDFYLITLQGPCLGFGSIFVIKSITNLY